MRTPPWPAKIAIALGYLLGTWALVDGMHLWITGDYLRWRGRLGPWAALLTRLGLDPMRMAGVFVVLGALWMLAGNLYLFKHTRATWLAMLALIVASSWVLGPATVILAAQLVLLLLPATRRALRP